MLDKASQIMEEKKLPKLSVSAPSEQISSNQLDEGIALCNRNACRFLKDADLLYSNRSYGHALAFSVLALEEQGRKIMLVAVKKKAIKIDRKLWNMMFRDHGQKLAMTFNIFTKTMKVKPPQEELEEIYRGIPSTVAMKNRGLYVDFFKNSWHSPSDADVKRAAKTLLPWVKGVIRKTDRWLNF
jgi:AbiV family abortive infection protein